MKITLQIPTALRHENAGGSEMELDATTVGDALLQLAQMNARLYRSICNETGAVRPHLHVFLNNQFVRAPEGLGIPLNPGDVVTIMTAVSGG